ncbi:hypothetical protein L2E82_09014 [Cichorium intybus]|uniref:Uncharacterized protein n=1 Tax=Cichorium intybus TaxID=13427 RepID=A0ACB9G7C5_CICIN|nr:hypothetical protein L2E82_09014 [Cichorium intybus]
MWRNYPKLFSGTDFRDEIHSSGGEFKDYLVRDFGGFLRLEEGDPTREKACDGSWASLHSSEVRCVDELSGDIREYLCGFESGTSVDKGSLGLRDLDELYWESKLKLRTESFSLKK